MVALAVVRPFPSTRKFCAVDVTVPYVYPKLVSAVVADPKTVPVNVKSFIP